MLLLAVPTVTSMQEMLSEYRSQQQALSLYQRHAYSEAETAFRQLLPTLKTNEDKRAASYNLACTLYMQGNYKEAAPLFSLVSQSANDKRSVRSNALFNEGNTLAMQAFNNSSKADKRLLFSQSLKRFRQVLLTNPNDNDAKINYEIVERSLQELEQPRPTATNASIAQQKNRQQPSAISSDVAKRLLEHAQNNESALMRQLSQQNQKSKQPPRNNKDW